MTRNLIAFANLALLLMLTAAEAQAQDAKAPYPSMAPLDQYLMERQAEITLARSAAPPSISQDAEVMVLRSSTLAWTSCNTSRRAPARAIPFCRLRS
jgi:hypothetical protein